MRFIPSYRSYEAEHRRRLLQFLPEWIGRFRPIPSGAYAKRGCLGLIEERDEITSEPVLMRALPRCCFRSSFHEQSVLPDRASECLEDFVAELYATGLMGVDEIVVQSLASPRKFRLQKRKVAVDRAAVHDRCSFSKAAHSSIECSPVLTEGPQPEQAVNPAVKGRPARATLDSRIDRMQRDVARGFVQNRREPHT